MPRAKTLATVLFTTASLSLLIACGDTSSGGSSSGGDFSSSVDDSTPLSDMTTSQADQFCDDLAEYTLDEISKADQCNFLAVFTASTSFPQTDEQLQSMCTMLYDDCMSNPREEGECEFEDTTCEATVGEYEPCHTALIEIGNRDLKAIPRCSEVTLEDLEGDGDGANEEELPEACQVVDEKCPDLLEDE